MQLHRRVWRTGRLPPLYVQGTVIVELWTLSLESQPCLPRYYDNLRSRPGLTVDGVLAIILPIGEGM